MGKRKASINSISSEPETLEVLRAKLAKAEGKKAAKKPTHTRKKTKPAVDGDHFKSSNEDENVDPAMGKRTIIVNWSDKSLYFLTDALLSLVEDSEKWRQAFGFVRTTNNTNLSQGKKTHEHYEDLAAKLFHDVESPKEWHDVALKDLGTIVKNRVTNLKKAFRKHREALKETGHGLIANDNEASIEPDSEIANVWDKIQKIFPWYKRVNKLMGTSPAIDKSAVAHSTSPLDLAVLNGQQPDDDAELESNMDDENDVLTIYKQHKASAASPPWDIEDDLVPTSPPSVCGLGSPEHAFSASSDIICPSPIKEKQHKLHSTPLVKRESGTKSAPNSTARPRKSVGEQIADALAASREAQLASSQAKLDAHLAIEDKRAKSTLEIERMRMQYQLDQDFRLQQDREAARKHDLLMMDKQLELERLKHGFVIQPNLDSQ